MAKHDPDQVHDTSGGPKRGLFGLLAVVVILCATVAYASPTAAALVLLSILTLILAIGLFVKFWSDAKPDQDPVPVPLPPPSPPAVQTQLKLLLSSHMTQVAGRAKKGAAQLAFMIDRPPPGSRLLRYDTRLKEWIAVPWDYDAGTRVLIVREPLGDSSIWVLEEKTTVRPGPLGEPRFSDRRRPNLFDRFPDQTP